MKKKAVFIAMLLVAGLLLASCSSPKIEGTWTVTGGRTADGDVKNVSGLLGEHKVVLRFSNDKFTMVVEDSYTKEYSYQYKDGKITFEDTDSYISFSESGRTAAFNVRINGNTMTWTLPGSQRTIEFSKE